MCEIAEHKIHFNVWRVQVNGIASRQACRRVAPHLGSQGTPGTIHNSDSRGPSSWQLAPSQSVATATDDWNSLISSSPYAYYALCFVLHRKNSETVNTSETSSLWASCEVEMTLVQWIIQSKRCIKRHAHSFWAKQPVELEVITQLYIHNPKLLLSCIATTRSSLLNCIAIT